MKVVNGACTELGASQTENFGLQTGTTTARTGKKHTPTGSFFLQTETGKEIAQTGIWSPERNPITCLDKEFQTEPETCARW